jgi:hypothetical protein
MEVIEMTSLNTPQSTAKRVPSTAILRLALTLFLATLLLCAMMLLFRAFIARAASGSLTVEIGAAYNLVVDSNVRSPSTYGPAVATVMGRFCNTSTTTALHDVWGYIGDYIDPTCF